jgi:hypothetical protein
MSTIRLSFIIMITIEFLFSPTRRLFKRLRLCSIKIHSNFYSVYDSVHMIVQCGPLLNSKCNK